MHQTFGQAVASLVGETQPGDRVERITLLRAATAIAPLNNRNAFGASMFRDADLGLELRVDRTAQPAVEYLTARREQRLVAGRIANLGQHRERPMSAPPGGVYMRLANEPLVAA